MTGSGGWRTRRGHSLVELTVALVLLAVGLGAVGLSALLGSRWTDRGIARQEAVAAAAHVLDSLVLAPGPVDGAGAWGGAPARWTVRPGPGAAVVLEVRVGLRDRRGPGSWLRLTGLALPPPPPLEPGP